MGEEFNQTLLHIYSRLPLRRDRPRERLVIQCDALQVQETPKLYVTREGARIRKDHLLKLRQTVERVLADYEVYCLPGDETAAAAMIHQRVAADNAALSAYAAAVGASVQQGYQVVDREQWSEMCLNQFQGIVQGA